VNRYKIDYSAYSADTYPYALYAKGALSWRWKHVASFRTVEEAKALHAKIAGLPIVLYCRVTGR
jgi:hypothetical protein